MISEQKSGRLPALVLLLVLLLASQAGCSLQVREAAFQAAGSLLRLLATMGFSLLAIAWAGQMVRRIINRSIRHNV